MPHASHSENTCLVLMKRVENRGVVEVISTRERLLVACYGAGFLVARLQWGQKYGILSNLLVRQNNQPISKYDIGN